MRASVARTLKVLPHELRLETSLKCGQSFRWIQTPAREDGSIGYRCALKNRVVTLFQTESEISYTSVFPDSFIGPDDTQQVLHDYLNLDVQLTELYRFWSSRDPHFERVSPDFLGLRMLRQDPLENLLSFICSSNNNISRITQMVQNLCRHYGREIATLDGQTYYDFPELPSLMHTTLTEELRALGFGYRAKFISATAHQLAKLPEDYLATLRTQSYADAHVALMQFTGVGAKVADCVCLMSLDKHEAVPIDTHVLQIAQRDYKFRGKGSSMTKVLYNQIKEYFIELWGPYAGWAHSVLFAADLKAFKAVSTSKLVKREPILKIELDVPRSHGNEPEDDSQVVDDTVIKEEFVTEDTLVELRLIEQAVKQETVPASGIKREAAEADLRQARRSKRSLFTGK